MEILFETQIYGIRCHKRESSIIHTEQQSRAKVSCGSRLAVMHYYHCSVFRQLSALAAAGSLHLLSTKFVHKKKLNQMYFYDKCVNFILIIDIFSLLWSQQIL